VQTSPQKKDPEKRFLNLNETGKNVKKRRWDKELKVVLVVDSKGRGLERQTGTNYILAGGLKKTYLWKKRTGPTRL